MPNNEPFTPPRKKHHVLWWLGGFFILLALVFVLQLFGPNPPIAVSPQTTFITQPVRPDGLPDYEKYLLDLSREGVTPENNAMTLLWPALFPADLQPQQFAAVTMELGLDEIPSADDSLERLHGETNRKRLMSFLNKQTTRAAGTSDENEPESRDRNGASGTANDATAVWFDPNSPAIETIIDRAMTQPWTSSQLPPLAEWVQKNEKPLNLIVEASRRSRYYAPSPTLLDNQRNLLIEVLLPLSQAVRETYRALSARAMWHLGEGRPDEAWQDVLAIHRLSHLFTQGQTLVEQLIAMGCSSGACDATITLLHHGNLTADQARLIYRDLAGLAKFSAVAPSLNQTERIMALDAFARVGSGGGPQLFAALSGGSQGDFGDYAFDVVSVDWNLVLRDTNRWYDRLVGVANNPDRAARAAAMQKFDADLQQLVVQVRSPTSWLAGVVSRQQRSELVSSIMISMFLPAVNAAVAAEDRANATLGLVRLVAALAVYRAEQGEYPDKLDALVPTVLEALPVDLYNSKPLAYQRDGNGYLLYSLGENGTDDGGSNERMRILKGRQVDELNEAEAQLPGVIIPSGADDISIRVPRPVLELPDLSNTEAKP